jgi:hypothetical protein
MTDRKIPEETVEMLKILGYRQPDDPGPDDMGIDEPHASTWGPLLRWIVYAVALSVIVGALVYTLGRFIAALIGGA